MRHLRRLSSSIPQIGLLGSLLFLAASCGGGGGGGTDPAPPTANLTVTGIEVVDAGGARISGASLVVGHPFSVEIRVQSAEAADDVTADLYIVDRESFDAPSADPQDNAAVEMTNYHVGSVLLGRLEAGENVRTVEVVIPYTTEDLDHEGNVRYVGVSLDPTIDYYIFADIDPADLIAESDEEDNRPDAGNLEETMVGVGVDDAYMDTPNLVLQSVLLEVPSFEVATTEQESRIDSCGNEIVTAPEPPVEQDVASSHLKATAVLNATGRYWPNYPEGSPSPIPRIDIQATLKTPGLAEIPDIPVMLWDSVSQTYSPTLTVQGLEPGTPMSVSLEFRLPGPEAGTSLLNDLVGELATKAGTCVSTCNLDRACFAGQLAAGTCDQGDLAACGGNIDTSVAPPSLSDPDWGCYVERIDGVCLSQCNPDLDCILGCVQESVDLEVTATAFASMDPLEPPMTEYQPGFTPDNDLETELVLRPALDPGPPAPTDPVRFETGFDKSFSAKLVFAGLSANAWAGLDGEGASVGLEAALPVVLFRSAPSACNPGVEDCLLGYKTGEVFLGVRSSLSAVQALMPGNNLSNVDIYAFGQNLFPKVLDFTCGVMRVDDLSRWNYGGKEPAKECATLYPTLDKTDPQYAENERKRAECLRERWAFGKSTRINKNFVVGVVPLTASFEAWGLIGAEVSLDLPDNCAETFELEARTGPWADLGTAITAGVGNSRVFSAGVGGELDPLFGDTFFATVAVNDLVYDTDLGTVTGALHEDVTNTLTGPRGNLFFYVGYPCIKICRKWGIPYPCGFKQCRAKLPIVGFKTFELEDVLFCAEQGFVGPAIGLP